MKYEIKGTPFPVVECTLDANESMNCEAGAMSYMSGNMLMETHGGGLGKMFSRAFSGESMFNNTYTAQNTEGMIAFASKFPGQLLAIELKDGKEIILQKSAYLASTVGVNREVVFNKKLSTGLFGGEGFIMQKCSGNGIVFVELDGSVVEKELKDRETMQLDTGYLAMMDSTCSIDITSVKGLKNKLLGGEGFFNTTITGPGKVYIQTMPIYQLAQSIIPYVPTSSSGTD